jgi:hypothetical protein
MQVHTMILGILVTLAASGCGTAAAPGTASPQFAPGLSSSLVMSMQPDSATWEYGRNDMLLNVGQQPIVGSGWAEIRTYDRLRTSNGRPQDTSTTYTRTLSRRGGY